MSEGGGGGQEKHIKSGSCLTRDRRVAPGSIPTEKDRKDRAKERAPVMGGRPWPSDDLSENEGRVKRNVRVRERSAEGGAGKGEQKELVAVRSEGVDAGAKLGRQGALSLTRTSVPEYLSYYLTQFTTPIKVCRKRLGGSISALINIRGI